MWGWIIKTCRAISFVGAERDATERARRSVVEKETSFWPWRLSFGTRRKAI